MANPLSSLAGHGVHRHPLDPREGQAWNQTQG